MKDSGKSVAVRDYLATRRSIPAKQLGAPGPDKQELEAILTIGARVPDHGKLAPWRFIVIAGNAREALGEALAAIAPEGADPDEERARLMRAPVIVVVASRAAPHPKIPEWEQTLSAGAVCLNLLHGAHAYGYRAQWLTEWVAYDERACALFGLSPSERLAGFIYIGSPQLPPTERARPDLADIVTFHDGRAA